MVRLARFYYGLFLMISLLFFFSGCAFINVQSLLPTLDQLEEKTISGKGEAKILLLDISGPISERDQTSLLGTLTEVNQVALLHEELKKAREDKKIKAVVLKINSPGGTVTASDIIYHELRTFKEDTGLPLLVAMMDLAASGGYYIAMAADKVIAHPTTTTGSIGVIMLKFNLEGLMEKIGVEAETIKAGEKKNILSPFHKLSPENEIILQQTIDSFYQKFIDIIAASRPQLTKEQITLAADGRIYTAQQALELKLIDGIGYLEDVFDLAKKEAGLDKAKVILYARPSEYRPNMYAHSMASQSSSPLSLSGRLSPQFFYLWLP